MPFRPQPDRTWVGPSEALGARPGTSLADVAGSPLAKSVTSWPSSINSSVRRNNALGTAIKLRRHTFR
jgi:hypothetical protein